MAAGRVVEKIASVLDREEATSQKPRFRCHLETLYSPIQSELDQDSGIDVVAIQNPEYGTSTWLYPPYANGNSVRTASESIPPAKLDLQKLASLPTMSSSLDAGGVPSGRQLVNWLEDSNMLRHEIANARIMNFEYRYATDVEFRTEEQDLVANELMHQLHEKRATCPARTLLFIACGMGGVLLQAALTPRHTTKIKPTMCTANSLLSCLAGIVLLTIKPFAFSTLEEPEIMAEFLEGYWRKLERPRADELLRSISPTLPFRLGYKMRGKGIPMICFHRIGTTIPRIPGGLDSSALAESDDLMSRYSGPHDFNYLTVLAYIKKCIQRRSFFDAMKTGDGEKLRRLLKEGIDPNLQNRFGKTALHLATLKGWGSLMEDLLNSAADIEVVDNSGRTALHFATRRGDEAIVQILLKRGADADAMDDKGQSPAMLARLLAQQTHTRHDCQEVWRVFQQRPLLEGPSISPTQRRYKIEVPPPSSVEQRYACDAYRAVVAKFFKVSDGLEERELRSVETKTISDVLYGSDISETSYKVGRGEAPIFTWYHIPSNNVSISEDAYIP